MALPIKDPRIYETLVAGIKDYAIFILSPEGIIQSWNLGARLIKGYSAEEVIGQHFSMFYCREAIGRQWPERELRMAAADGRFEDEGWRLRKDGTKFWANVIITALRQEDGRLIGYSKVTRDLTLRRGHEEKLRQSEERFRLLIEGVQDYALCMLDNEGLVSSWNSGAQRIYGYAASEVLGRHFSWLCPADDIKAGKPWQELRTARATGRAVEEGWRVRKTGERFWAHVVITALYDAEGTPCGFAKITQDLTERRQLKEAEVTARRMNEFIAMLAHELRNPLAPILNAVEALEKSGSDAREDASLLGVIARQARHLARIVDDLIDINRIARGTLPISRASVDLADVVNSSVEAARPAMDRARQRLEVRLPQEPLIVFGDLHRLTQVMANILNNASRYTAPSGVISVTAQKLADEIVLSVKDTGRGIPREDRERIFNLFDQGTRPAGESGSGLGIGLSLARRIVELHGGTISVESDGPGRGSVFHVRLPRALVPIDRSVPVTEAKSAPALSRRRVLVVDDHVDAARMLQLLLQCEGHEARIAHDGPTAIKAVEEFKPEFVFLDIGMPGMNGYEIARTLRDHEHRSKLLLIALTGWGQPSDIRESKEAGFDLHLVKPLDTARVKRLLETASPRSTLH
ncbi:MAG TPA: PAS domain S-box protein [Burkholderiales bacterium]|nr:PAS domain S-box protein [Burkholderiales bacterium]